MKTSKTFGLIIPARLKSSRLPGKPLVDICGKPMIQHVWERCCNAVGDNKVYIATDDQRIADTVKSFGGQVVMTSENCLTGRDRVAEANESLNFDFVINVQGDEPLIDPVHINKVVTAYIEKEQIINAMCKVKDESDFRSLTIPKVVFNEENELLYMSRAGIPFTKFGNFKFAYKQVCIYAFSREHLSFFKTRKQKSNLESVEDIEILRFLEAGYTIQMVEVESGSIAVDVPEDVERVALILESSFKN